MDLNKQLEQFYNEMDGNQYGGLLIFVPENKHFVRISYGTGDNLLHEDLEAGYDDYLYITVDEFNDGWVEDIDGSQVMLKMQAEWNGHYNICQHIKDGLEMLYDYVPEVIVLQSFMH